MNGLKIGIFARGLSGLGLKNLLCTLHDSILCTIFYGTGNFWAGQVTFSDYSSEPEIGSYKPGCLFHTGMPIFRRMAEIRFILHQNIVSWDSSKSEEMISDTI